MVNTNRPGHVGGNLGPTDISGKTALPPADLGLHRSHNEKHWKHRTTGHEAVELLCKPLCFPFLPLFSGGLLVGLGGGGQGSGQPRGAPSIACLHLPCVRPCKESDYRQPPAAGNSSTQRPLLSSPCCTAGTAGLGQRCPGSLSLPLRDRLQSACELGGTGLSGAVCLHAA